MSCHVFWLLAPNRYEVDLSNEVLNFHFGQGASKYQRSKLEVEKNHQVGQIQTGARLTWQIFFQPPTLTSDIFVAP